MNRIHQCAFGDRVQTLGRLVQQQDRRIAQQCPRDGDAPCLATGEAHAGLADPGVVTLGQVGDEVVDLGRRAGLLEQALRGLGGSDQQVLADAGIEQMGVL